MRAAPTGSDSRLRVGAVDLAAALEGFTPAAYWGVGKLSGADAASQVVARAVVSTCSCNRHLKRHLSYSRCIHLCARGCREY